MDTTRWKSILVPKEIYEQIVTISHIEGRTISGQLRVIFESWKKANLSNSDQAFLAEEVEAFKKDQEEPAHTA
mgnify:FL=1|tara:strand:- start:196 stop:414 length:219 start_codon:yes stop_codon:yes gene_type:complete